MIWAFFFSSFAFASGNLLSGVLPVSTQYENAPEEVGSGFVIRSQNRTFVFTCAHLTGGTHTKIDGISLEKLAKGRRTDSFHDVDLIEIDSSLLSSQVFAQYTSGEFVVEPKALEAWKKSGQQTLDVEPKKDSAFALVPHWSQSNATEASFPKRQDQWSVADMYTNSEKSRGLVYNVIGGTLWAPASIAPGMSCSPLIDRNAAKALIIRGMGTEFKNKMMGSTFASDRLMARSFEAYFSGETGEVSKSSWHWQKGLLYQEISPGRAEIVPQNSPAGNGISTSPGNGISTSPGSDGSSTSCNANTASPANSLSLLWDDKTIMGFMVQAFGEKTPMLVFPNHTGIEYRLKIEKFARVLDLPTEMPIISEFDRFYSAFQNFKTTASEADAKSPSIDRYKDRMKITLYGPAPKKEKVIFELNEFGALVTNDSNKNKNFAPIIEVAGPSGRLYTIDLTGLFFSDISDWDSPVSSAPSSAGFALFEGSFLDHPNQNQEAILLSSQRSQQILKKMSPHLSYRQKCSRDEFHFSFPAIKGMPDPTSQLIHFDLVKDSNFTLVPPKKAQRLPSSNKNSKKK